jgi:hypothetical protein
MSGLISYLPESIAYALRRYRFMFTHRDQYQKLTNLRRGISAEGYTLKPFDDHQAIFIHVPKNAGQSVRNSLFENLQPGHINVYTYQLIYPKSLFESYYKFAFTRNPWDRLVSAYMFMKGGGAHEKDRKWAEKNLVQYSEFETFVRDGLPRKKIQEWPHFKPQVLFLKGQNGKIKLDFIGRFETIQDDFEQVRKHLGISRELQHINKTTSKRDPYRSYYSEETREIAANVYREDITAFGYEF